MNSEFENWLASKNISSEKFKAIEPAIWLEWSNLFSEVHPESFILLKKFQVNPIRRRFPNQVFAPVNEPNLK